MIYLLFLFFCCLYLSILNRYKPIRLGKLLLYGFPVIFSWGLLLGGQYNVGTDYSNYLEIFRSGNLGYIEEIRGEFLFSGFISALYNIGIRGQGIYLVLSIVWVIFLFGIINRCVGSRWAYLFLFVFIVFPGMFNNQMNGIRQFSAIYILTTGTCFLLDKQYPTAAILLACSIFVHKSAAIIILGAPN